MKKKSFAKRCTPWLCHEISIMQRMCIAVAVSSVFHQCLKQHHKKNVHSSSFFISVLNSTFVSMQLRSTLLVGSMPRLWEWKVRIADFMLKLTVRSNLPACFCLYMHQWCVCPWVYTMYILFSCIQPVEWPRWIQENGLEEHPLAAKFL